MLFMLFRYIKRCLFSLKGAKTQMIFALLYCHDAASIYPKEKKKAFGYERGSQLATKVIFIMRGKAC